MPELTSEVVAFSDANATWAPDALRKLVRSFADPDVGYVCGRLELGQPDGTSREPLYWRYELWVREASRRSPGSRRGTAPSTRCAARTTARPTRVSATTSGSRT